MRRRDHERIVGNLERQITYLQRQNDTLVDKLMYMTGKTWTPPPVAESFDELREETQPYSYAPEQAFDAVPS